MYYIGIDPGQEGAIAVMGKGDLKVFDMPVVSAKGKPQLDFANLGRILRECSQRGDCIALVERVGSMPGQGLSSTFKFGMAYGGAIAALATLEIPYELITPATWKRTFRLVGGEKEDSRQRALELFPQMAELLKFKKHHGRAEALLLAEYLRRRQTQGAIAA
jgi:hypothetical protein